MPKKVTETELTAVLKDMADFPQPASLEEIAGQLSKPLARRTLQRRLANLVAEERLVAQGSGSGTRYQLPQGAQAEPLGTIAHDFGKVLSPEAKEIKRIVSQPASRRQPVGYHRSFLENYRPNVTRYLPPALRRKLAALGRITGEAQPAGTYLRKVMDRLLIDLSWNSSRLEGNTYSLLETQRLLELGESAEGKAAQETQMILNHKAAIEMLADHAEEIGFNRYTLCNLHALLSENLLPDPAGGGKLRAHAVAITGSVFHPLEMPSAIEECFDQIMASASAIDDAFEQAFFAMVHLPYLQPFEDVNKRVSRLAANIPLVQRNLGPLSFVDVPQSDYTNAIMGVYELNRVDYLRDVFEWAYERSCARYAAVRQSIGEPDLFRMRHRERLGKVITAVVGGGLDKRAAAALVRQEAKNIPDANEQKRFAEMAETELTSLHGGNFVRYRLRPAQFEAWQKTWL
ncbi:MAG: Fic family protein [Candidatus Didemnitutus sp.]|nr:Fic family protein [Candidatus Didemnitutus sp.]